MNKLNHLKRFNESDENLNISDVIRRLLNEQIIKHGKLKFGNTDNGRIFIGLDENNEICSFKIFDNGEIEKLESLF